MKHLNYSGEFISVSGVVWRVDILTATPLSELKSLNFDANPLQIEWPEESKEEPLCGSVATLNIISPSDREYVGLYTEDHMGVRMNVYRGGVLYWCGYMDPEFYEEPYVSDKGYVVTLTFSDLGVLERNQYNLTGHIVLSDLLQTLLISDVDIDCSLISGSAGEDTLMSLSVDSYNFYDEDGVGMSYREVLRGVLQPLALRIVQRSGKIWLYDLNAVSATENRILIDWQGTNQRLGTDKVYNNVKITWSPYVLNELGTQQCWTQDSDFTDSELSQALEYARPVHTSDNVDLYAYHYNQNSSEWNNTDFGFALLTSREGHGATLNSMGVAFYKIVPGEDGSESEGIAIKWSYAGKNEKGNLVWYGTGLSPNFTRDGQYTYTPQPAVTFSGVHLPKITEDDVELRISINMLMDPRYNPFEQAPDTGIVASKEAVDLYDWVANLVYVPVSIKFRPEGSDKIYVWQHGRIKNDITPMKSLSETKGEWVEYKSEHVYGYLCWYELDREGPGIMGWKKNRPAIDPHGKDISFALKNAGYGQIIPYPPESGGDLWVEVLPTPWMVKDAIPNSLNMYMDQNEQYAANLAKWILMEPPTISIERASIRRDISGEDVEYAAVLNSKAKETLSIDTICGTAQGGVLLARGAYRHSNGRQVQEITRAGRTSQAENLWINTLYSQFASRHAKLQGTAAMHGEGVCAYLDSAHEGIFMMTGAVENLREDTVEGTYVEVSPDEYEPNE